MEYKKFLYQILLLANEDYSGLWEVYGEASGFFDELSEKVLISVSKKGVLELIIRGWIQLYWCNEPLTNERVSLMDTNQFESVLSTTKYWDEPEKNSISVRFTATEDGERAFLDGFSLNYYH